MTVKSRIQTYVETHVRNWLAFASPGTFNLSGEMLKFEYLRDTPSGCRIRITDPHWGPEEYEVTVVRKAKR